MQVDHDPFCCLECYQQQQQRQRDEKVRNSVRALLAALVLWVAIVYIILSLAG